MDAYPDGESGLFPKGNISFDTRSKRENTQGMSTVRKTIFRNGVSKDFWPIFSFLAAIWLTAGQVYADGGGFAKSSPKSYSPKVEIPDQQALIQWTNGVEHLVVETSFLGEGTNFAWVLPLPAPPEVKATSADFFADMRGLFEPRLISEVNRYYLAMLCAAGCLFLIVRVGMGPALRLTNFLVCLGVVAIAVSWSSGLREVVWGFEVLVLYLVLGVYSYIRSWESLFWIERCAIPVLHISFLFIIIPFFGGHIRDRFYSMAVGGETQASVQERVRVLSVEHAGVFDVTTIRGADPQALLEWLRNRGYSVPDSVGPVVRKYINEGWVFVASEVRRGTSARTTTALHPLAFRFPASRPVYPLKLTGAVSQQTRVDLYVLGQRRAAARDFKVVRCLELGAPSGLSPKVLPDADLYARDFIAQASVGTKLSARLTAKQMRKDTEVLWRNFSDQGETVYSRAAALDLTLDVVVAFAIVVASLFGMIALRHDSGVAKDCFGRWRWWLAGAALLLGVSLFYGLPKTEVTEVERDNLIGARRYDAGAISIEDAPAKPIQSPVDH